MDKVKNKLNGTIYTKIDRNILNKYQYTLLGGGVSNNIDILILYQYGNEF